MVAGTYECSVHHIQDNYVYVMLRNVTELEKTKLALEQKNKELSQLTSIASHDLKDPLNTITSFAQILNEEHFDSLNKEGQEIVSYISESTKRMRSLITDLLDYGRLGQDKIMDKVDCNKLIEEIQQDLAARIKESEAEIKYNNLPIVIGLETELRLLFQNLISNGIKFRKAEKKPLIEISAVEKDGWTFTVEDHGIGIDPNNQKNIFSLFKRVKYLKEIEGDGIGLAHCKKIVELHQGKLWLESEPGKGSKFHFNIPLPDKNN
jgi:light-regulated signal transduction histidine kinase (bacteriophytochrome)